MTRNEAKQWVDINSPTKTDLIDEIYDDFESRVCENCIYSQETDDGGYGKYCTKVQDYMYEFQSCNKFERKTDED